MSAIFPSGGQHHEEKIETKIMIIWSNNYLGHYFRKVTIYIYHMIYNKDYRDPTEAVNYELFALKYAFRGGKILLHET